MAKDDEFDLISDSVIKLSTQGARAAHDRILKLQQELDENLTCARTLRRQHEAVVKVLKGYTKCGHACVECHCTRAAKDALDLLGEDY